MNLINAVQSGRKGSYIDRNIKMLRSRQPG